jgi:hypothetical protein
MMYYLRAASGGFIETIIEKEKMLFLSRDVKVFKMDNNKVFKTNNYTFGDLVKNVPEGAICGEVAWDFREKDVTDTIIY